MARPESQSTVNVRLYPAHIIVSVILAHPDGNLSKALATLGWSQAELGRRLGVHRNTVSSWAAGTVPAYVRAYLALAIGIKGLLA